MNVADYLSAFGLGALVVVVVQAWLTNRRDFVQRRFNEKKEAYVGYLDALHRSEIHQTGEDGLNAGHWANRIELVGSQQVISACASMLETNPTHSGAHPKRKQALAELKEAMRKDLGLT